MNTCNETEKLERAAEKQHLHIHQLLLFRAHSGMCNMYPAYIRFLCFLCQCVLGECVCLCTLLSWKDNVHHCAREEVILIFHFHRSLHAPKRPYMEAPTLFCFKICYDLVKQISEISEWYADSVGCVSSDMKSGADRLPITWLQSVINDNQATEARKEADRSGSSVPLDEQ